MVHFMVDDGFVRSPCRHEVFRLFTIRHLALLSKNLALFFAESWMALECELNSAPTNSLTLFFLAPRMWRQSLAASRLPSQPRRG